MSQEVKRQHYVPRTYLKNFAVDQGNDSFRITALPIEEAEELKMFQSNIEKVCVEKNLYTLPGESVRERMLLESFYSNELEGHYTTIYNLLVDPNKTEITDNERHLIISTVSTMFYRTTMWINKHNEFMRRTLTMLFEVCNQTGKDYFNYEDEKISIAGKSLDQLVSEHKIENRPLQVLSQLDTAFKLVKHRKAKDGVMVIKLNDDSCKFITSDNPVIAANINGQHVMPFDNSNVMKLPLDSKHMLLLMPYADEETKNIIIRHNVTGNVCKVKTATANSEQFKSAEKFVLGEQSALENFIAQRKEYEKPLTPEQLEVVKAFDEIVKRAKDDGLI